ncbi:hypothetical protein DSCO28_02070 [Desulfosarcina ovata subsp. sediminis]|uniref:Uncharacterized protein n=1 Tax=Desulfosarcina ovata subsp. sediminis TaxID=885957 RepID=A0A5K7ZFD8_9BACT|nr:hypothetical protein [Desulfosarcina ovata]BBO79641.1 hypothetical protein DSCO28_02070 [Desulfosarcina ovata subsp. sediminis]
MNTERRTFTSDVKIVCPNEYESFISPSGLDKPATITINKFDPKKFKFVEYDSIATILAVFVKSSGYGASKKIYKVVLELDMARLRWIVVPYRNDEDTDEDTDDRTFYIKFDKINGNSIDIKNKNGDPLFKIEIKTDF